MTAPWAKPGLQSLTSACSNGDVAGTGAEVDHAHAWLHAGRREDRAGGRSEQRGLSAEALKLWVVVPE